MKTPHDWPLRRTLYALAVPLALGLLLAYPPIAKADDEEHHQENRERGEHEQELREAHDHLRRELDAAHERDDRVAVVELQHELRVLDSNRVLHEEMQRVRKEERERGGEHSEGIERRIDELTEHMERLHQVFKELEEEVDQLHGALEILAAGRKTFSGQPIEIKVIQLVNDYSLLASFSDGMEVTFRTSDIPRQLTDLHAIYQDTQKNNRSVATVNLLPERNIPITFAKKSGE